MTNEEKARQIVGGNWMAFNKEYSAALQMAEYINNEYAEIIKQHYDYASKQWTTRRRRWEAGYLAAMHDIFVACLGEEALIHHKLGK